MSSSSHILAQNTLALITPVAYLYFSKSSMMSRSRYPATDYFSTHNMRSSEDSGGPELTKNAGEAPKTSPGSDGLVIKRARSLALLLSFFSPSYEITHDFLRRGGSPRKRWTPDGGIEDADAIKAGLSPELTDLLSDSSRLENTLSVLSSTVLKKSDQGYFIDAEASTRTHQDLPTEATTFWKTQALIVAYRACPWKYLEPTSVFSSVSGNHIHFRSLQI